MSLAAGQPAARACHKPELELADVVRRYGQSYRRDHPMPLSHQRVLRDIEWCRTARLGGHRESCEKCDYVSYAYNSCRNRHCPKCQSLAKAKWLEKRNAELLPVPYFHNVFTLPHELNSLILGNSRLMLNLLFRSAAQTLLQFGRNHLNGKLGFTMVLHTWDQTLGAHFHLHCVIAGGALADDGEQWIWSGSKFLFAVHALSKVFRGKFLDGLKAAQREKQLRLGDGVTDSDLQTMIDGVYAKPWVVYSKRPFAGPRQVLDYLGRYTHRVAIGNHRIQAVDEGRVSFRYRDRVNGDSAKVMTLEAPEFIRRFLLHVLPSGFMRIRHFGFLANRRKKQNLRACRVHLGQDPSPPPQPERTPTERISELTGVDVTRCPRCGQRPLRRTEVPPLRFSIDSWPRAPALLDSS